ncbi:MAG: Dabb family protein [Pseudomonadota bacterium]
MIRHIVLTKFSPETDEQTIAAIYEELAALVDRLPGAGGFTGGRSQSPEQIERGYMHGFTIDFDTWDALEVYADHSEHKQLGARLVASAVGGKDGILVVDWEA